MRGRFVPNPTGACAVPADKPGARRDPKVALLMLDVLTHDLRGRLAVISGAASLFASPTSTLSDENSALLLHLIEANAASMDVLLTQAVAVAKRDAGEVTVHVRPTDVVAVVRDVVASLRVGDHPVEIPDNPVVASVDPFVVERIVENLVTNALNHTPDGTTVRVGVKRSSDTVLLTVDNDGRCLGAADASQIFDRFQTGSSARPGLGLGLSLVKRLATLHGGDAWLDQSDGTSFRVTLSTEPHRFPRGTGG